MKNNKNKICFCLSWYHPSTDEIIDSVDLKISKKTLRKIFYIPEEDQGPFACLPVTASQREGIQRKLDNVIKLGHVINLNEFCYFVEQKMD